MSDFAELGIAADLVAAAAAAGLDEPTPLQSAAIPVLRRGGNAALIASSGSGVTAAWALALLDRLYAGADAQRPPDESAEGAPIRPRALILTASDERASRAASALVTLAGTVAVPVRALSVEWSTRGGGGIVTASIGAAARGIRESTLKLDRLEAAVFEDVSTLRSIEGDDAFDALVASIPPGAQRILTTADWSKPVERFVEAHARRALTIPARAVAQDETVPPEAIGTLSYITVASGEKVDALARILRRSRAAAPLVSVRTARRAALFADALRDRGFRVNGSDDATADARIGTAGDLPGKPLIAGDVPFDSDGLAAMDLADGIVLVEPAELPHLKLIAREAAVTLQAVGARPQRTTAAAYREEIRRAMGEQDIDAQIALLEPLFERHSAVEIAAGLSALLREKRASQPAPTEARAPGRPPAFVRLFVSAGTRDNIGPGDIVGAITGEASVKGEQIGKIELRDTFSVVEVSADVAERVIRALNGTTLRGRSLRVDFDRKTNAPPRPQRSFRPQRS
jgi:ATP-dependent RNA helicase DeaD